MPFSSAVPYLSPDLVGLVPCLKPTSAKHSILLPSFSNSWRVRCQGNKQPAGHVPSIIAVIGNPHIHQGLAPSHPNSHHPILKPRTPKEKYFAPSRKEPVPVTAVPSPGSQQVHPNSCGDGRIRPPRNACPGACRRGEAEFLSSRFRIGRSRLPTRYSVPATRDSKPLVLLPP